MDYFLALGTFRWSIAALFGAWLWWRCGVRFDRRGAVLFGLAWVFLATVEFWVLGTWSYADLPVTVGTAIPTQLRLTMNGGGQYDPAIAGGNDVDALLAFTGQYVSLERLLLDLLPLWLALVGHKLLVSGIAFAGTYRMSRAVGAGRAVAAALAASFVFGHEFIIGPTWAHGLGYAIMPMMVWLGVCRWGRRFYWLGVVVVSALYSVSSLPTHSGLAVLPLLPLTALMLGWRRFLASLPATFIVLIAIMLNWHESFYAKLLVAPYTLRGSAYSWQADDLSTFLRNLLIDNTSLIVRPLIVLAVVLCWVRRFPRTVQVVGCLCVSTVIGAVLCEVPWAKVPGLGLLGGLNLNNINFVAIALAPMAVALVSSGWSRQRLLAAGLLAFAAGNMAYYKAAHATVWLSEGGMSSFEAVRRLDRSVIDADAPVRVAVVPYRLSPNMLWPAGIETLDGYYNLVLTPVAKYWDLGLLPPTSPKDVSSGFITFGLPDFDMKCCDSYDLAKRVDLDLLRAANVGFVVSALPLEGLEQVAGPGGGVPTRRSEPLGQRIRGYAEEIVNPPPLRVYRLGNHLPRLYAAGAVIDGAGLDFAGKLALVRRHGLERHVVLDRDPGVPAGQSLQIRDVRFARDRVMARLDAPKGGVVVVNVPWTPFWHAFLDGQEIAIVEANLIQMAVAVPAGGRELVLDYRRPTLWGKLTGKGSTHGDAR